MAPTSSSLTGARGPSGPPQSIRQQQDGPNVTVPLHLYFPFYLLLRLVINLASFEAASALTGQDESSMQSQRGEAWQLGDPSQGSAYLSEDEIPGCRLRRWIYFDRLMVY